MALLHESIHGPCQGCVHRLGMAQVLASKQDPPLAPPPCSRTWVGASLSSKPSQVRACFSSDSSTFFLRFLFPALCLGLNPSPFSSNLAGDTDMFWGHGVEVEEGLRGPAHGTVLAPGFPNPTLPQLW